MTRTDVFAVGSVVVIVLFDFKAKRTETEKATETTHRRSIDSETDINTYRISDRSTGRAATRQTNKK